MDLTALERDVERIADSLESIKLLLAMWIAMEEAKEETSYPGYGKDRVIVDKVAKILKLPSSHIDNLLSEQRSVSKSGK